MDTQQSALAYARAYELFSEIYQHGLNDDLAPLLGIETSQDNAHSGAEHYNLFVHNVFPYEAIFLGDDGLLGGTITEDVSAFYHQTGFQASNDESPDHISNQFSAIAYLCYAELDAIEDNIPHEIHRIRHLQRRFLDEHLLRWFPAFVVAIEQQEQSVYTGLVRQSFELVCSHRDSLGDDLMATENTFVLAIPPDLLSDEKTSLRDIARYLLTPAYTGFFLSVDDIRRIGATYRVPHGFGKRQQILTNLLRVGSDYDVFTEIIADFQAMVSRWIAQFEEMTSVPNSLRQVWINRLRATVDLLGAIAEQASAQQFVMDDTDITN